MSNWTSVEGARQAWPDAPLDDVRLTTLLEVARGQVLAYAPASDAFDYEGGSYVPVDAEDPDSDLAWTPAEVVPANYAEAQLRQAVNLWNAGRVDAAGAIGTDEFVYRPHPLDWVIKQIIRPRKAVPHVR